MGSPRLEMKIGTDLDRKRFRAGLGSGVSAHKLRMSLLSAPSQVLVKGD